MNSDDAGRGRTDTNHRGVFARSVGWKTILGAAGIGLFALVATQILFHRFFMDLSMFEGHIASTGLHAVVVLVPVLLFIAWRGTAEAEVRVRERLRASEALREELTHMLVHDLKNPLVSAGLALGAVMRDHDDGPHMSDDERELLLIAKDSLSRLERMIGDMLDVSRAEAGRMPLEIDMADLSAIVRSAAEQTRPQTDEAGITLALRASSETLPVRMDARKIRRVIDNLLSNAIKFTPPGGRIELTVEDGDGEARVTLRDTGIGIPDALKERIFEKFGQAIAARHGRSTSVGLGLYFSKLVIDAHGGRIWVESTEGEGSLFGFALPLIGSAPARPA